MKLMTKIDKLNEARTNLINTYLDLYEENLEQAKDINGLDYTTYMLDSKVITIKLGRRMGASTYIKDYLLANPNSDVICTNSHKEKTYKGLNAVSDEELICIPPTAFIDHVVFIDLPPGRAEKVLEKYGVDPYCKCIVIV